MKNKIAIIGAGASGLVASIELAKKGFDVVVFEKNNKIGKKLLATGNGRCNISNKNISKKYFHSFNIDFIDYTLSSFNLDMLKKYFSLLGLELVEGKDDKYFPATLSSSSVVDLLVYEAKRYGVKFELNYNVKDIVYEDNYFKIDTKIYKKLILANGSYAMPKLGGTNSGYKFATQFGHTIIEPFSSLVQLVCDDKDMESISGLKIDAKVQNRQGDLLFTKYGLSGSMILDISRDLSYELQYNPNITISIDTMPSFSKDKLLSILTKRLKVAYTKDIVLWLDGFIHKKLATFIVKKAKLNKQKANELNKKDILKIVFLLKNLSFNITSTKGFDFCEVCAGGVDTTQIDNKTFESKLQKNLYIIGELLDIDGDCGGYNLHFAFGSGYLCGKNMKG